MITSYENQINIGSLKGFSLIFLLAEVIIFINNVFLQILKILGRLNGRQTQKGGEVLILAHF